MFTHSAYIIETLTNTHVGSGDTTFGVVDRLVQKDPVTRTPVFHSSSLKGAIKEHMEDKGLTDFARIFGESEDRPGEVKFYEARTLTLPLRSTGRVYYNCTSPDVLLDYLESLNTFQCTSSDLTSLIDFFRCIRESFSEDVDFYIFNGDTETEIEDYKEGREWQTGMSDDIKKLFRTLTDIDLDSVAIFKDKIFSYICEDSLPVIARNHLNNEGISQNLFYEEILPRRSRFWFMIGYPVTTSIESDFETNIVTDIIQMGGNASIGYGATRIRKINGGQ